MVKLFLRYLSLCFLNSPACSHNTVTKNSQSKCNKGNRFKKIGMMNCYGGEESAGRRHRRGGFWKHLGDCLGTILRAFWGPFWDILGVRNALAREYKKMHFGECLLNRFFLIFQKKLGILGPEKGRKIGPKMVPKRVAKKSHLKNWDFHIFLWTLLNILYFTGHNGPRGPILLCFTVYSRVRKGRKMTANVAKTLEKQWFLNFFCDM